MKIVSWNVNGIRACDNKGFKNWIYKYSPDILGIQETKANEDQLDKSIKNIDGYFSLLQVSRKKRI
jgi:exodeoxyribonuclease III